MSMTNMASIIVEDADFRGGRREDLGFAIILGAPRIESQILEIGLEEKRVSKI